MTYIKKSIKYFGTHGDAFMTEKYVEGDTFFIIFMATCPSFFLL